MTLMGTAEPSRIQGASERAASNRTQRPAKKRRMKKSYEKFREHAYATVAGARQVPVGWTVLVECVSRKRDAPRDSADGTRLEGRDPRKHGWQPWRGARLREDQDGSTGKFLAGTRAPLSLRRARCGRTPPKSYATACGLESAHAPLLAKTPPMNCPSPR